MRGNGSGRCARGCRFVFAATLALGLGTASAHASSFTFTSSQGALAASAKFEVSGTNLIITLTNTSPADVLVPADILTALFFDVVGAPLNLTRTSALLGPTSDVLFGPQPAGDVVGGEWAYETGIALAPGGQDYGISSAGFGIFGSDNRFPGPNIQGANAVNGLQYGLVSAGDNPATGNAAVTGGHHLIKNEVVFTLAGIATDFDPETQITHVFWQYGTSLSEPGIPEPATLSLMAVGALLLLRRRGVHQERRP